MAKRNSKKSILGSFDFNRIDPYGGVETQTAAPVPQERLNIRTIMPDPQQPRQLLPRDLAQALFTGAESAESLLTTWLARADASGATPAIKQSIDKLRQLAATIEHQDLINPITVRPNPDPASGSDYLIVTGERRWWAHVLLTMENRAITGNQHPDRIRATIVGSESIRALQLIENVARDDLSVIERAQGMIALRDEMATQQGQPVTWSEVEEMLGISRSYRSRILKVLKLAPEAQDLVARYNLPEKTIRPITAHLVDAPRLQMQALRQIVNWQAAENEPASFKRVAEYVDTLIEQKSPTKPKKAQKRSPSEWVSQFNQKIGGTLKLVHQLSGDEMATVGTIYSELDDDEIAQLRELRNTIDQFLGQRG